MEPLVITTQAVELGTSGVPYFSQLQATGGVPPYMWSLASGFTPAIGLTMDRRGVISGTPTQVVNGGTTPSAVTFTAQVVDSAGNAVVKAYSIAVNTAPPVAYAAPTDFTTRVEPSPVPTMGPANSIVTDDISGFRILRVTDSTLDPTNPGNGSGFTPTTGTAETTRWSALGNYFAVVNSTGWSYFFQLNKTTFQATAVTPGGKAACGWGDVCFDAVNDTLAYGIYGLSGEVHSLNLLTGASQTVWSYWGLMSLYGAQYAGDLCVANNGNMTVRVGTQDNSYCVAALVQGVQHVLDTRTGTIDGVRLPVWPSLSLSSIHNVRLGQDGRYCKITLSGAAQTYLIWDLEAPTPAQAIVAMQGIAADQLTGHQALAWGRFVNGNIYSPQQNINFLSEHVIRGITNQADSSNPVACFTVPPNLPGPTGGPIYASWGNAVRNLNVPFIVTIGGDHKGTSGAVTGPHERELLAISTDGLGTVCRLCHHYGYMNYTAAGAPQFYDGIFANVSRDGRYVLFSSNWANTLLPNPGRRDCFVLELK